jgi:sn-glycerol 3-phosphate transport system permease protein
MTVRRGVWRRHQGDWTAFVILVAPNMLLFAVFTWWPILHSAWLSLTNWNFLPGTLTYVGLDNYTRLAGDPEVLRVLLNTVVYMAGVVAVAQVLALSLALLLNQQLPGRALFRAIAFTPHVTTTAAAALVWVLVLDPRSGPLGALYRTAGAETSVFGQPGLALLGILAIGIWKETGFASLFYLAGLQGLPESCYESAQLDGASAWQRFRHITLPLITPVTFFLVISGLIAAAKVFDLVAMTTEGGPVYPASATYVYHLYRLAFREFRAGYASAFAMIFFVILVTLTAVQFRLRRHWVHHEE